MKTTNIITYALIIILITIPVDTLYGVYEEDIVGTLIKTCENRTSLDESYVYASAWARRCYTAIPTEVRLIIINHRTHMRYPLAHSEIEDIHTQTQGGEGRAEENTNKQYTRGTEDQKTNSIWNNTQGNHSRNLNEFISLYNTDKKDIQRAHNELDERVCVYGLYAERPETPLDPTFWDRLGCNLDQIVQSGKIEALSPCGLYQEEPKLEIKESDEGAFTLRLALPTPHARNTRIPLTSTRRMSTPSSIHTLKRIHAYTHTTAPQTHTLIIINIHTPLLYILVSCATITVLGLHRRRTRCPRCNTHSRTRTPSSWRWRSVRKTESCSCLWQRDLGQVHRRLSHPHLDKRALGRAVVEKVRIYNKKKYTSILIQRVTYVIVCALIINIHINTFAQFTYADTHTSAYKLNVHTHAHAHTHAYAHAHAHTHAHVNVHTHAHAHAHARTYTPTHTYAQVYAFTHTHAHVHAYAHAHTMYAYMNTQPYTPRKIRSHLPRKAKTGAPPLTKEKAHTLKSGVSARYKDISTKSRWYAHILVIVVLMCLIQPAEGMRFHEHLQVENSVWMGAATAALCSHSDKFLKICTVNCNSIRNKIDEIVTYLTKHKPDILLTQETHLTQEECIYVEQELNARGYEVHFNSLPKQEIIDRYVKRVTHEIMRKGKDMNEEEVSEWVEDISPERYRANLGLATIVKSSIAPVFTHYSVEDRIIVSMYKGANSRIAIVNIYAPTSNATEQKRFFEETLASTIKDIKSKHKIHNIIVAGDFNATICNLKDRWTNYAKTTHNKKYEWLAAFIAKHKLIDTWRSLHPQERDFTWMRCKSKEEVEKISRVRIDYFLTTKNVHKHICKTCEISHSKTIDSDHDVVTLIVNDFIESEGKYVEPPPTRRTTINIGNRKPSSKEDFYRQTCQSNTISELKDAKLDNMDDIERVVTTLTEEITKISHAVYGKKVKHTPPKRPLTSNAEVGTLKQAKNRVSKLLNYIQFSNREEIDTTRLNKYACNAKMDIPEDALDNEEIKSTVLRTLYRWRARMKHSIDKLVKEKLSTKIREAIENLVKQGCTDVKAFYNKMRGASVRKQITYLRCIKNDVIHIITDPTKIKEEINNFWKRIFKSAPPDPNIRPQWLHKDMPALSHIDTLTQEVTIEEIRACINDFAKNKAPGADTIPIEIFMDAPVDVLLIYKNIYNACIKIGDIPHMYKLGTISPIFKKGDPYDLNNYRPIALLNVQYKVFSKILNARLVKVVEKNKILSRYQGEWQKDKHTTTNARVLVSMLEDARAHNADIHICYIDLVKAYDSVEHWAIRDTLQAYNFGNTFADLIYNMLRDTQVNIQTAYGPTEYFVVEKGVRQGDVISPILFALWINPLLQEVENKALGYKMHNHAVQVPILAFADDIAIMANNHSNIADTFKTVEEFFLYNNVIVSHEKSAYTHTKYTSADEYHLYFNNKEITKLSEKHTYKYLGLDISASLDWDPLHKNLKMQTVNAMKFITRKRTTNNQKIKIVNCMIHSKITYRMNVVTLQQKWLEEMDDYIATELLHTMRLPKTATKEMLWLSEKQGGKGLNRLTHLQVACTINSTTMHVLNGDPVAAQVLQAQILDYRKQHYKYAMRTTQPHTYTYNDTTLGNYMKACNTAGITVLDTKGNNTPISALADGSVHAKEIIAACKAAQPQIHLITEIMNNNSHLMSGGQVGGYMHLKISPQAYRFLEKTLCEGNSTKIKEEWRCTRRTSHIPQTVTQSELSEFTIIEGKVYAFTDGSRTSSKENVGKQAGAGVFFKEGSIHNKSIRIPGTQDVLFAELYAIELALSALPQGIHAVIVVDNISAIRLITKRFNNRRNIEYKTAGRSIIRRIIKMMDERNDAYGADTTFKHIYSHINDKLKKISDKVPTWEEKINVQKRDYGDTWEACVAGNEGADVLAGAGADLPEVEEGIPKEVDEYVIIHEGVITEGNTYSIVRKIMDKHTLENMKGKPSRGAAFRDHDTDHKISASIMNAADYKLAPLADYIFKARQCMLVNRNSMHNRAHPVTSNKYTTYMQKVYDSNKCMLCYTNETDDNAHLYTCTAHHHGKQILRENMLTEINKVCKTELTTFPWWFSTEEEHISITFSNSERALKHYDKKLGDRHYIPAALQTYLCELGAPRKEATRLTQALHHMHVSHWHGIYTSRCDEHTKLKEAHVHKRKVRTCALTIDIMRAAKKARTEAYPAQMNTHSSTSAQVQAIDITTPTSPITTNTTHKTPHTGSKRASTGDDRATKRARTESTHATNIIGSASTTTSTARHNRRPK